MKHRINLTSFIVLFAAVIMASCGGKKGGGDGKKYDISFATLKGPSFKNSVNTDMKIETSVMGMSMNIGIKLNADMHFDVLPDTLDNRQLRMTYDNMSMTMDMPMLKQMGQNSADISQKMDEVMKMFKGSSLVLVVDKKGNIQDVKGTDEFREHIMHSMDSAMLNDNVSGKAQVEKSMQNFYDKDQLQNMLGAMFSVYTNEPVAVGSSWTKETNAVVNNLKTKSDIKYTLVSVKDGVAEIKAEGKLTSTGASDEGAVKVEADMKGEQTGTLRMKLDNGHVVSSEVKMSMDGDVKASGLKMPMKLKAVYTISEK